MADRDAYQAGFRAGLTEGEKRAREQAVVENEHQSRPTVPNVKPRVDGVISHNEVACVCGRKWAWNPLKKQWELVVLHLGHPAKGG